MVARHSFALLLTLAWASQAFAQNVPGPNARPPATHESPSATPASGGPITAALDDSESTFTERAASKLLTSTCTLRISTTKPAAAKPDGQAQPATNPAANIDEVTVCSGVALGGGRIVTFASGSTSARYRVTLPGGQQANAEPRVFDHYSGLVLLEIDDRTLPGLELSTDPPKVGSPVLTAAAAGIEQPAVSQGILGGLDRTLAGVDLPPLLQCDVRTTETSSGAAVVDRHGKLIGIVAATGDRSGWTYAISAREVQRLIAAQQDKKVVELKRRRPVVGLTVGPGEREGVVLVDRVEAGGPAQKAGIMPGDLVLEAEGRKVRSAYQVVALILRKQPGDTLSLNIQHGLEQRTVQITLDGAPLVVAADTPQTQVGPRLTVSAKGGGQIEVRSSGSIQELGAGSSAVVRRSPGDEVQMLRTQLDAFDKVIRKLQDELNRRNDAQAETDKLITSLREEVARLRKQSDESK